MARLAARVNDVTPQQGLMLAIEADTAAYFGHVGEGRELSRQAAESAEQVGEKETAATYRAVSAFREALFGNAGIAHQSAMSRARSSARDLDYAAALIFAYAGDVKRAQDLADSLSKEFPEDTCARGARSRGRVSEDCRSSRTRLKRAHWSSGPSSARPRLCVAGRHSQGPCCLSGFPHALERRRCQHPHPNASTG